MRVITLRSGIASVIAGMLIGCLLLVSPAQAAFPGENGRIVFTSVRDGNAEIYSMNPDGSEQVRLTNDPSDDGSPTWSSDGNRIAFTTNRDGNAEIYVMNADGTNLIRLTNDPASDTSPTWSPDGTRLAFQTDRDGNEEIYVMNADGSGQTNITNEVGNSDAHPAWSPSGGRIAFSSTRGGLFVMNPDGSGVAEVTAGSAVFPDWSPDASRIAFARFTDGQFDVHVVNADGTGLVNLTNDPADDRSPAWSPDGTTIAFASNRSGASSLWTMDPDGSNPARVGVSEDFEPDWGVAGEDPPVDPPTPTCHDTSEPALTEDGPISRPVHQLVEPVAGPLATTVHDVNCEAVVPLGL